MQQVKINCSFIRKRLKIGEENNIQLYLSQSMTFKKLLGYLIYSYILAAWKYKSFSSYKIK